MNTLVSILWFLARLQLWLGSFVGPFLLVQGLTSFASLTEGWTLKVQGRTVETVSDRVLFVAMALLFSGICLSYTLYFRKRIDRYRLVKWGYILLLVIWPAFTAYPAITALACAVMIALFWWRESRRVPPGHCENCRYDLTGNVSGRCPECGEPVTVELRPVETDAAACESRLSTIRSQRIGWALGVLCVIGVFAACYQWVDWPAYVSTRWLMRLQPVFSDRALVELWTRYDRGIMAPAEAEQFVSEHLRVRVSVDSPQSASDGIRVMLSFACVVPKSFPMAGLTEWAVFVNGEPVRADSLGGSGSTSGTNGDWRKIEWTERMKITGILPGHHQLRFKANVGWGGPVWGAPSGQAGGPYGWLIDERAAVEVSE